MRMFIAGCVAAVAGILMATQMGIANLVISSELQAGLAASLLILGLWLLFDALRFKRSFAQLQLEASRLAQDLAQSRREMVEAVAQAADKATAAAKLSAHAAITAAGKDEVINLLALLQQKGRFLDFVMDDVTKYPDAQIGAAARVVHQGCAAVIREYFEVKPVYENPEGSSLTLAKDYDANRYRVIGRVAGEPPYRGRVLHRGWQTMKVSLPERVAQRSSHDVIAPAEVELS